MAKTLIAVTENGRFRGKLDENGVLNFLGIPYAAPPQRWKKVQPPAPSNELKDAVEYGPAPWQHVYPEEWPNTPPMSEDCLTLNVWTSDVAQKGKPVMVWIYGGSHETGSNRIEDYGGGYCGGKADLYYVQYQPEGASIRAQHCFEIPYWNGKLNIPMEMDVRINEPAQGKKPDPKLKSQIQGVWANMARFGDPNGSGGEDAKALDAALDEYWPPYDMETKPTMVIDNDVWYVEEHFKEKDTALVQHFTDFI